jgi:predicted transglutaminase-like cysteine proteinase
VLRVLLSSAVLLASCIFAHANAIHLNPSQPAEQPNMETFGRTSIPIGYYQFCQSYRSHCSNSAEPATVRLTSSLWNALVRVNREVNARIHPMTDQELFGVDERWELPTVAGDCEDYALMKRDLLLQLGFPLSSLLLTVGKDADGGGHAVLTVVTDRGDFVLDNVEEDVLLWRDAEISFLKRQSQDNPNAWESLIDG